MSVDDIRAGRQAQPFQRIVDLPAADGSFARVVDAYQPPSSDRHGIRRPVHAKVEGLAAIGHPRVPTRPGQDEGSCGGDGPTDPESRVVGIQGAHRCRIVEPAGVMDVQLQMRGRFVSINGQV